MPTWFTPGLWASVSLAAFGTGVLLLLLGIKSRYRGNDPHCTKCGYNLKGAASEVCPECGTRRTVTTVVGGQQYRRWMIACAGIALSLLALASCIPMYWLSLNRPPAPRPASPVTGSLRSVKYLISNIKSGCQAGILPFRREPGNLRVDVGERDPMVPVTLLIQNKMRVTIQNRVTDVNVKAAALAECAAANSLLTSQIIPAYEKAACKSRRLEDAKALVPLLDQLDSHMDNLLQILKGY